MEKNIVAIYKKIKVVENLYVYKFIEIAQDVIYNEIDDTIQYNRKGKIKTIYAMEDIDFTISDEKYCFNYLILKEEMEQIYEGEDALQAYQEDCCSIIRYGILEGENLKFIDSPVEKIIKAKSDIAYSTYEITYQSAIGVFVAIPLDTLQQMISDLKAQRQKKIEEFLLPIIEDALEIEAQEQALAQKEEEQHAISLSLLEEHVKSLIGLKNIKNEMLKLKNYLIFSSKIKEQTNLEPLNLNMAFLGNPGTGKTTIAKIMSRMFYQFGYIKENKIAELAVCDFVAEYVGQTAVKARKTINQYKGGVIFIDEAYAFSVAGQEYGEEALVEIIKEMEKRETIFIFAGYEEEMKKFIQMNAGLKSRIGYYLTFKDYTLDELYAIFLCKIQKSKLKLGEEAEAKIKQIILQFMHQEHFGNGRFIDNLFDKIIMNHASRCYNSDNLEELMTITAGDINEEVLEGFSPFEKTKKIGF